MKTTQRTDRSGTGSSARLPRLNFGFVLTPKWIGGFLFCCLFSVTCAVLGQWQMDRRMEAVTDINRVVANYDDPAVPYAGSEELFTETRADQEWTPVTLQGEYLVQDTTIVRNRPLSGRPGYEVLVPFDTDTGDTVVVNRGWVPIGDTAGRPDVVPAPPQGPATVTVRVRPGEPSLNRDAPQGQIPSIDLVAFDAMVDYPVARAGYGQLADEDPAPARSLEQPPRPPLDEGPHLSYALQWFLFGLMSFVVWGYLAWQKARNDRDDVIYGTVEDEGYHAAYRAPRVRPERRRRASPTDEEVEDALLDPGPDTETGPRRPAAADDGSRRPQASEIRSW